MGCTVHLTVPPLTASRAIFWEYKSGPREGVIISYAFDGPAITSRPYENRTRFNETDLSLQMVLQQEDDQLYRFRSEVEATGWFQLRVIGEWWDGKPSAAAGELELMLRLWQPWIPALMVAVSLPEPLSKPEIVGNSSVKAGHDTKLVCKVLEGKADLYWWKKNEELLLGSDRIQFADNGTLCIVKASMNDSGYYTCVVRNEVSQNETSFLLHVQSKWRVFPGAWEENRGTEPQNWLGGRFLHGGCGKGVGFGLAAGTVDSALCRCCECGAARDPGVHGGRFAHRWVPRLSLHPGVLAGMG